jgi:hypothetical protein
MKKIIITSLVVFVAIAMFSMPALAQGEDVYIYPTRWDASTPVYSDQNIVLTARWSACRRGAVQDFLTATNINWSLVGEDLNMSGKDTNKYWERPFPIPVTEPSEDYVCMGGPLEEMWSTRWYYTIGPLSAGDYTLNFYWWFDHPVTDVADYDGDGHPDLWTDAFSVETSIHVEDR